MFLRSIAAEFAKIFSTRLWWILAIVLFCYIGLLAGGLAALFSALQTGAISPDTVNTGGSEDPNFGSLPSFRCCSAP
jgi:hypothetical protein